jgi:hypothetical protein
MGWQIIRQPNLQYCVFSTVVDHFIVVNATEEELKEFYKTEAGNRGIEKVEDVLRKFDDGLKPYFQFTMTFEEAIETIKSIHGEFRLEFENGHDLVEKDFYEY